MLLSKFWNVQFFVCRSDSSVNHFLVSSKWLLCNTVRQNVIHLVGLGRTLFSDVTVFRHAHNRNLYVISFHLYLPTHFLLLKPAVWLQKTTSTPCINFDRTVAHLITYKHVFLCLSAYSRSRHMFKSFTYIFKVVTMRWQLCTESEETEYKTEGHELNDARLY